MPVRAKAPIRNIDFVFIIGFSSLQAGLAFADVGSQLHKVQLGGHQDGAAPSANSNAKLQASQMMDSIAN